jgi:hypothetical protein
MQDLERSYAVELRERDIDVSATSTTPGTSCPARGPATGGLPMSASSAPEIMSRRADSRVHVGILLEEVGRSSARLLETIRSASGAELVRVRSVVVRYAPAVRRPVSWTTDEGRALQSRPSRDSGS